MAYTPKQGDTITLELPDERTRAEIVRLVSDTTAIARLLGHTTANKSHNYRKDDLVPCRYERNTMNHLMQWSAVSERKLSEMPESIEAQA